MDTFLIDLKSKKLHTNNSSQNTEINLVGKTYEFAWILPNIFVKIKDKNLEGGKIYGKKGKIRSVFDNYVAEVELLENKDVYKIDQKYLETVIPVKKKTFLINKFKKKYFEF